MGLEEIKNKYEFLFYSWRPVLRSRNFLGSSRIPRAWSRLRSNWSDSGSSSESGQALQHCGTGMLCFQTKTSQRKPFHWTCSALVLKTGGLRSRNYLFSAPAPPLYRYLISALAPAINCYLKLFYNSSTIPVPMKVQTTSVAEPVEPKLFGDPELEPKINLNKHNSLDFGGC